MKDFIGKQSKDLNQFLECLMSYPPPHTYLLPPHTSLPPPHTSLPPPHTYLPPPHTSLPPSHTSLPPPPTISHGHHGCPHLVVCFTVHFDACFVPVFLMHSFDAVF